MCTLRVDFSKLPTTELVHSCRALAISMHYCEPLSIETHYAYLFDFYEMYMEDWVDVT